MIEYLRRNRPNGVEPIYKQLMRSGTSIMANVGEAQYAQSTADFITKLHISLKEASETRNWLHLLYKTGILQKQEYQSMHNDCNELIAILVSSIKTSKNNNHAYGVK